MSNLRVVLGHYIVQARDAAKRERIHKNCDELREYFKGQKVAYLSAYKLLKTLMGK